MLFALEDILKKIEHEVHRHGAPRQEWCESLHPISDVSELSHPAYLSIPLREVLFLVYAEDGLFVAFLPIIAHSIILL